jgi:gluconolactonase
MMYLEAPPRLIETQIFTAMPDEFRRKVRTDWADANRPGALTDCFIEGPSFDADGNLYVVDIPFGRIFRITPDKKWSLVVEYDGWPNGLKISRDGRILVADYMHGIMELDARAGRMQKILTCAIRNRFVAATTCISPAMATSTSPIRARPACTIRPGGFTG